jgi:hypothetical protein
MVEGIPELQSTHEGIFKGCALGKNIKKSFPSNNNRSKEILDLIHSDVCGMMPVKSLGGYIYYVIFIDDYKKDLVISLEDKGRSIENFSRIQSRDREPHKQENQDLENR